jgi:ribosomal-protein-alanine N-acetyltransferase
VLHSSLRTERLVLREWRDDDLPPFSAMNADPRVMEHFPSVLSREQSDAAAVRIRAHFAEHGYGLWAVEILGVTPFAGFVGLSSPGFESTFTPCVEIGWRLAREYQGHGFATEGARAALAYGFATALLDEIVSLTVSANAPSRRVMEKLGMHRDPADDFDHPLIPDGHPLRRHVLYRVRRDEWTALR